MPELTLSAGERLHLWIAERGVLSPGSPLSELRQSLASIGFSIELRIEPGLHPCQTFLSTREDSIPTPPDPFQGAADDFHFQARNEAILLEASSMRGFFYAVWDFLERLGWQWPTPLVVREPSRREWTFPECDEIHVPALPLRIIYAENTGVTPQVMRWLARHRFNTFFPSNPSRFAMPEKQIPEETFAVAEDLGMDLIIGGDCLDWLCQLVGLESELSWNTIGDQAQADLAEAALGMLRQMSPSPRLSVWGDGPSASIAAFLNQLLAMDPDIQVEADAGTALKSEHLSRALFRRCAYSSQTAPGIEAIAAYLFPSLTDWDFSLGSPISPLLWSGLNPLAEQAGALGAGGMAVPLTKLQTQSCYERAGFSLAALGRTLWRGQAMPDFEEAMIRAQFEGAGDEACALIEDLRQTIQEPFPSHEEAMKAHSLISPEMRERLDMHISALEECPPTEQTIELMRSLSLFANLYDLEETGDFHQSKALARTIWAQAGLDSQPSWLKVASPLAQMLKELL